MMLSFGHVGDSRIYVYDDQEIIKDKRSYISENLFNEVRLLKKKERIIVKRMF